MSDHNTLIFKPSDITVIDGQPRVLDLRLAEVLDFGQVRDIRKLIQRHEAALEEFGSLAPRRRKSRGQEFTEYHLNEEQAVFLCAKSETAKATAVTIEVVKTFVAYKNGTTPTLDRLATVMERMSPAALDGMVAALQRPANTDSMPQLQAWLEITMLDGNLPAMVWDTYKHVLNVCKGLQGKPIPLIHTRNTRVEKSA